MINPSRPGLLGIHVMDEGVLTRQLVADPTLRGTGVVILDELHERHLAGDLALALVRRLQRGARIGDEVGYEVRFDRKVGAATRIRFVSEGVLTRRLLTDPELRGTGAVLLD